MVLGKLGNWFSGPAASENTAKEYIKRIQPEYPITSGIRDTGASIYELLTTPVVLAGKTVSKGASLAVQAPLMVTGAASWAVGNTISTAAIPFHLTGAMSDVGRLKAKNVIETPATTIEKYNDQFTNSMYSTLNKKDAAEAHYEQAP